MHLMSKFVVTDSGKEDPSQIQNDDPYLLEGHTKGYTAIPLYTELLLFCAVSNV